MTAAIALVAGAVTELVVIGTLNGSVSWGRPLAIAGAIIGVVALALSLGPRVRIGLLGVALAALFAAPAAWATETIGHATSSTFPAGGPASAGFGGPAAAPAAAAPAARRRIRRPCRGSGANSGPGGFAPPGGLAPPGRPGPAHPASRACSARAARRPSLGRAGRSGR